METIIQLSDRKSCPFQDNEWGVCNLTGQSCFTYKGEGRPDGVPDNCPLTKGAIVVQVSEDGSEITLTQGE